MTRVPSAVSPCPFPSCRQCPRPAPSSGAATLPEFTPRKRSEICTRTPCPAALCSAVLSVALQEDLVNRTQRGGAAGRSSWRAPIPEEGVKPAAPPDGCNQGRAGSGSAAGSAAALPAWPGQLWGQAKQTRWGAGPGALPDPRHRRAGGSCGAAGTAVLPACGRWSTKPLETAEPNGATFEAGLRLRVLSVRCG